MTWLTRALLLLAAFLLISESNGPVEAYLDPGTGSMLIQGLLATIIAALAVGKVYWARLKALLFRRDVKRDSLLD